MRHKESVTALSVAYVCHFEPEPEGGYTVTCPALPPVVSYGETLDKARANAREAIELCLETLHSERKTIPPSDKESQTPRTLHA